MEELDVEFELFRKRVYNLQVRDFYLLLMNRGCDIDTLRKLFLDVDEKLSLRQMREWIVLKDCMKRGWMCLRF